MKRLFLGLAVAAAFGVVAACVGSDPVLVGGGPTDAGNVDAAPANPVVEGGPADGATAAPDGGPTSTSISIANADVFALPVSVVSFVPIAGSSGGLAYLAADAGTTDVTELSGDGGTSSVHHLAVPFTVASMQMLNGYAGDYAVGGQVDGTSGWAARFAMDGGVNAAPEDSFQTTQHVVDVGTNDSSLVALVDDANKYAVTNHASDGVHVDPVAGVGGASEPLMIQPNGVTSGQSLSFAVVALNSPGSQGGSKLEVSVWMRSTSGGKGFVQPSFFQDGNAFQVPSLVSDPSTSYAFAYGSGSLLVFQTTSTALKLSVILNTTADGTPHQVTDVENLTLHAGLATNGGDKAYVGGCQGVNGATVPWLARVGKVDANTYTLDQASFGTGGVRTFPELPAGSCIRQLREDDNHQIVALIATPSTSFLVRIPP